MATFFSFCTVSYGHQKKSICDCCIVSHPCVKKLGTHLSYSQVRDGSYQVDYNEDNEEQRHDPHGGDLRHTCAAISGLAITRRHSRDRPSAIDSTPAYRATRGSQGKALWDYACLPRKNITRALLFENSPNSRTSLGLPRDLSNVHWRTKNGSLLLSARRRALSAPTTRETRSLLPPGAWRAVNRACLLLSPCYRARFPYARRGVLLAAQREAGAATALPTSTPTVAPRVRKKIGARPRSRLAATPARTRGRYHCAARPWGPCGCSAVAPMAPPSGVQDELYLWFDSIR
jgi:hypothetical protein